MKEQRSLRGKIWKTAVNTSDCQSLITQARTKNTAPKIWNNPQFTDLADPLDMLGIKQAKTRIEEAINQQERIMVYGDFDCDGITSTVALVHGLKRLGAQVSYRIPERGQDSHGLKHHLINEIVQTGTTLLITVDCGANDRSEVDYAVAQGLEVIITDHHQVDPERVVTSAVAIVNPQQLNCLYPFTNLAGVGVVFKLLQALKPDEVWLQPYLALAAVGTVADCVALTGESRMLVQLGLQALNKHPWAGLKALLNTDDLITEETIGFQLAPCLNAASRLGKVQHAIQLFLGDDFYTADRTAYLENLNQERRELTQIFTTKARDLVVKNDLAQVLFLEKCPVGILGLVASRLSEQLGQAVFCINRHSSGALHGSARGLEGGNITAALNSVATCLTTFGGHKGAAGFRLDESALADFITGIKNWYKAHPPVPPVLEISSTLTPQSLTTSWYNWQQTLAPFGIENPRPVWRLTNLSLTDLKIIGRSQLHARLTLNNQHAVLAFFVTDIIDKLEINKKYDWAITLHQNVWQGEPRLQWQLVDVKPVRH